MSDGLERPDIGAIMDEGVEDYLVDEAAQLEDVTAESLRQVFGDRVSELSDEELLKLYEEAPAGEQQATPAGETAPEGDKETPPPGTEGGEEQYEWKRPWSVMRDGEAVADPRELRFEELLEAKLQYNVDGEAVDRNLDQVVRIAQQVPLQERRIRGLVDQRAEQAAELEEMRAELEQRRADSKFFRKVLTDQTGQLYQAARDKLVGALLDGEDVEAALRTAPAQAAPEAVPTYTPQEEQAGEEIFGQYIKPELQGMAERYSQKTPGSPDMQEIRATERDLEVAFRYLVNQEGRYLTEQRIVDIVNHELPNMLFEAGYSDGGAAAPVTTPAAAPELAELKAELDNLKASLGRDKLSRLPGAGGEGGPGGAGTQSGDPMDDAKSLHDVKALLNDPNYTAGL
jgi:hypothetical protein